jgi:hypothetical protein
MSYFLNFGLSEHIMGPGSNVGFPISANNKNKQTWHEWSLGGQLSKLCPATLTSIQDGHHQQT